MTQHVINTWTSYELFILLLCHDTTSVNMAESSSVASAPGGLKNAIKRKNAQDKKKESKQDLPLSTRQAGAGGSSANMMKLFTDEAAGLRVDPLVVLFLAVGFIFSVIILHVFAKITGKFTSG